MHKRGESARSRRKGRRVETDLASRFAARWAVSGVAHRAATAAARRDERPRGGVGALSLWRALCGGAAIWSLWPSARDGGAAQCGVPFVTRGPPAHIRSDNARSLSSRRCSRARPIRFRSTGFPLAELLLGPAIDRVPFTRAPSCAADSPAPRAARSDRDGGSPPPTPRRRRDADDSLCRAPPW